MEQEQQCCRLDGLEPRVKPLNGTDGRDGRDSRIRGGNQSIAAGRESI